MLWVGRSDFTQLVMLRGDDKILVTKNKSDANPTNRKLRPGKLGGREVGGRRRKNPYNLPNQYGSPRPIWEA